MYKTSVVIGQYPCLDQSTQTPELLPSKNWENKRPVFIKYKCLNKHKKHSTHAAIVHKDRLKRYKYYLFYSASHCIIVANIANKTFFNEYRSNSEGN